MNLEQRYQDVVSRLQKGHRVLDKLESEEIEFLKNALLENRSNITQLEKVLCLIENTRTLTIKFEPELLELLSDFSLPKDITIYILNACRKHSISSRIKSGDRLTSEFMYGLKNLFQHEEPEVIEWTLRVVDECGPQGVFFYKDIKELKPTFTWIFNKHRRAIVQLVDMFHKRWAKS